MKTNELDYFLPPERIAQHSVSPRDASKLLVYDRATGMTQHKTFRDVGEFLRPDDLLVFNNSKVFRARLFDRTGQIEIFLLRPHGDVGWECLGKPGRRLRVDDEVVLSTRVRGRVVQRFENGRFVFSFVRDGKMMSVSEVIAFANKIGEIPIPPYVGEKPLSLSRYQTVYAKHAGSVAAPTAGFHFTRRLLGSLRGRGVRLAEVTLHVGIGTFQPIKTETIEAHTMHREWADISVETARLIAETKARGGRVIAVGTTTVRALEGLGGHAGSDDVNIFINPGYSFKVIDGLITNFHLPRSTLLLLVSAFLGEADGLDVLKNIYNDAIARDYRFYSFGDALLIL